MKILLVADRLDVGGAETHIYELSRSLLRFGHEVALISLGGRTAELIKKEGAKTVGLDPHTAFRSFSPNHLSRLLSLFREYKPDVVHAHTRKALFLCRTAQTVIPFPLVFTAHAKFTAGGLKGMFTNLPLYSIAVSSDIKKHFSACFGADEENITVIENGIDTDRFSPTHKNTSLNIVTVSRLDRDCSLSARLLCLLVPKLVSIYPHITVTVVGGGNSLHEIKSLVHKANQTAGRQVISCVGNSDEIPRLINKSSLFVGVSRAALEAMSCNKPVIICGNEGYFGICRQDNFDIAALENFCARGYGVPNEKKLLRDIINVLSNPDTAELKLRDRILSGYRAEHMAKKTEKLYLKAACDFLEKQKYDALLCGYYGFGNAGDELVKERILNRLSSMNIGVIGARGEGRIWRFNIPKLCRAVKNSSGVILGGGSLLQNATSRRSLEYYLLVLKIADFYGKKAMLYANGVGPLHGKTAESACIRALAHVDFASARDTASFELLSRLLQKTSVLRLSCDPALCTVKSMPIRKRIVFFLRGEDIDSSLQNALLSLFDGLGNIQLVFASMNAKQDEKATVRLASKLQKKVSLASVSSLDELTELIGGSFLVISSRLHALIIAASSSRPFVALCRDPKLTAFTKECGLPPLLAPHLDAPRLCDKLKKAVSYAIENQDSLSAHLSRVVSEISQRADSDTAEALRLFSKKRLDNSPEQFSEYRTEKLKADAEKARKEK